MTDTPTPASADARAALAEFDRWAEGSESDGRGVVWRVLRQDGDAYDVVGEYASRSLMDKFLIEERMKATLAAGNAQSPASADVIEGMREALIERIARKCMAEWIDLNRTQTLPDFREYRKILERGINEALAALALPDSPTTHKGGK